MKYEPGERDMIMLQHKFVVQWADGQEVRMRLSYSSCEAESIGCYL